MRVYPTGCRNVPTQPQLSTKEIDSLCDRFETAWRTGAPPRIEDFLVNLGEGDHELLLRELLFIDHEYRCRAGNPPEEDEYRTRFPEYRTLVDAVLASGVGHQANSQFATGRYDHGTAHTLDGKSQPTGGSQVHDTLLEAVLASDSNDGARPTLGDYELLEEVGRGGMGIVFRARQKSVSRIVAVKLLRRDKLKELSPDSRETMIERFRTEAQSAAQLQHDHIVPVYEVGEEGGLYYYSMRFVAGDSLADAIKDHPLDNRTAAEMIEPIARALDEAHRCGVLHRDIKPRNVIVEKKTQRPLLTDFGLAKLLESDQEMTRTGDVMGSPPYMSPEQSTDAASVTQSADIYSLGATMYHILTGRAPFQAANVAETLRQVLFDEPIPPRQLNPGVDRDLETITLKCLEKEPARRFVTAGELAEELQRFLRGEPIKSRPISPTGHFVRVCRRNPVVSSLGFAIAGLLTALPIVFAIGYFREAKSRREAEQNLGVARENLGLAAGALEDLTDIATSEEVLNAPGLDDVRRKFLMKSREYYDRLVKQRGGGESLRAEQGKAYGQLADIEADLGNKEESMTLYQQAIDVFANLSRQHPDHREYARLWASYQINYATLQRDAGDREAAQASLEVAHDGVVALLARKPDAVELLELSAYIHAEQSVLLKDLKRWKESEAAGKEAISLWRQITKLRGLNDDLHKQAESYYNLGGLYAAMDRDDDAQRQFELAFAVWEHLAKDHYDVSAYMAGLAKSQMSIGILHLQHGDWKDAEERLGSAQSLRSILVGKHARVLQYRVELALSHDAVGNLYQAQGNFSKAAENYRAALLIRENLRNDFPNEPEYEVSFAASQNNLGALYRENDHPAEAVEYFRTALEILQRVVNDQPEVLAFRQHLAGAHHNLADALHAVGQFDEARAEEQLAIRQRQTLIAADGNTPADRDALAESYAELAEILQDQDDYQAALDVYEVLLPLRRQLAAGERAPLHYQLSAAETGVRYGVLLLSQDKLPAALTEFSAAIQSLDACKSNETSAAELTQLLHIALDMRAQVRSALGQHEQAIDDWDKLLSNCTAEERPLLALRRAQSLARGGRHAEAVKSVESIMSNFSSVDTELELQALRVYSRAIEAVEQDASMAAESRAAAVQKYVNAATTELQRLVADDVAAKEIYPELFWSDQDLHRLIEDPTVAALLATLPHPENTKN